MSDKTYESQLRDVMVKIKTDLGVPVVYGNQIFDKPKYPDDYPEEELRGTTRYPFICYVFQSIRRVANIPKEEILTDKIRRYWEEQHEFTISFTACSNDIFDCVELIQKMNAWLTNSGYEYLRSKEIICVSTTPAINRDSFLVNDYERRNGFDVRLRMAREVNTEVNYIEKVIIPEGQILK